MLILTVDTNTIRRILHQKGQTRAGSSISRNQFLEREQRSAFATTERESVCTHLPTDDALLPVLVLTAGAPAPGQFDDGDTLRTGQR